MARGRPGRTLRAAAVLILALAGAAAPAAAQDASGAAGPGGAAPAVLIVNRNAVVEQSDPAQALRATEREIRTRVQRELDRVKAELEAEEQELTRLKETMPPDAFSERARAFDQKVREQRGAAQERSALLLRFLKDARQALASALPRVLEGLRREMGAQVVLDAGAALAADPALDVTEEAIARYNARMGEVRFDPPDALMPE